MINLNPDQLRAVFIPETRTVAVPINGLEWRESGSGDGSRILSGYAAVYEQETTLFTGMHYTIRERIAIGAFNNVLAKNPDVHLSIGHDMTKVIARTGLTGIGGLELRGDAHGLRVYARLSPRDPDVQSLAAKMDLKIMDQMSFSFRVLASGCEYKTTVDANGHETDLRVINEIAELFDVCICAKGSYTQTEASLRMLLTNISGSAKIIPQGQTERSIEVPPAGVGAAKLVDYQRQALLARARMAANKFKKEN